jgi:stage V sporulation protein D (sporulation-specific penicillin-binding protein)
MPQLARAFCAVANGGVLIEPHLVSHVVDRDGKTTYRFESGPPERVMSEKTAATLRELCYQVVAHGTGTHAAIKEFRAGGKTGTGQVARPDGGGYYEDQHTAIFAGFAPLADPQVCAVIVVHNPRSKIYYGGYVCGPVFRAVVRETLIRLNCPEDPMGDEYPRTPGDETDADVMVAQAGPTPEPQSAAGVITTASDMKEPVPNVEYQRIDRPAFPSFQGMTKRQAQEKLASLGIPWESQGSGWVVAQEPAPGAALDQVDRCRLVFSNKRSETRNDLAGPSPSAAL